MNTGIGRMKNNLGFVVEARERIADEATEKLYEFICGHPGLSIYEIAKELEWSPGKTTYLLKKLEELDVIRKTQKIEKNRIKLEIYKKDWSESLPIESLKELKELMKKQGIE